MDDDIKYALFFASVDFIEDWRNYCQQCPTGQFFSSNTSLQCIEKLKAFTEGIRNNLEITPYRHLGKLLFFLCGLKYDQIFLLFAFIRQHPQYKGAGFFIFMYNVDKISSETTHIAYKRRVAAFKDRLADKDNKEAIEDWVVHRIEYCIAHKNALDEKLEKKEALSKFMGIFEDLLVTSHSAPINYIDQDTNHLYIHRYLKLFSIEIATFLCDMYCALLARREKPSKIDDPATFNWGIDKIFFQNWRLEKNNLSDCLTVLIALFVRDYREKIELLEKLESNTLLFKDRIKDCIIRYPFVPHEEFFELLKLPEEQSQKIVEELVEAFKNSDYNTSVSLFAHRSHEALNNIPLVPEDAKWVMASGIPLF